MMTDNPVTEIIRKRYSCRTYSALPVDQDLTVRLQQFLRACPAGPFGSCPRFELITADDKDRHALKDLGTYGFIRNPAGFILGAVKHSARNLEDFGYVMERNILCTTGLGLGTCWLGGSFTRSTFWKNCRN